MNRVYGSEFLGKNQGETISVAGWFFGRLGHANDVNLIKKFPDHKNQRFSLYGKSDIFNISEFCKFQYTEISPK